MKKNTKLILLICAIALIISMTPVLASAFSSGEGLSLQSVLTSSTSSDAEDVDAAPGAAKKDAGLQGGSTVPEGAIKLVYDGSAKSLVGSEPDVDSNTYRYKYCIVPMNFSLSEIKKITDLHTKDFITATNAGNYRVLWEREKKSKYLGWTFDGSYDTFVVNIAQAALKVKATDQVSYVGDDIKELTYTYSSGAVNNKLYASDSFSGALTTNADKNTAGTYDITQGDLSAGDNYSISYTKGTYTVKERTPQNISFDYSSINKTYGDSSFKQVVTGNKTDATYSSSDTSVATVDSSTGEVTILKAGTATITATAAQAGEYASATASYTLTVNKAKVALPTPETDLVYNGKEQTGVVLPDVAKYTLSGNKATDAGQYTAIATLTDKTNYEWDGIATSNDQSIKWSIGENTQTLTFDKSSITKTYGESSFTQAVEGNKTTVTYSSSDTSVATVDSSTGEVTILKVGEATIKATAAGNGNYAAAEATYELVVNKANISVDVTAKKDLIYNATEQEVLNISGNIPEGAQLKSRISTEENYQDGIVKCTEAGTYTIYYKINGGDNYNDVKETEISVTITPAEARIGDNYYATFEAAVAAANNDETVTLLRNAEIESQIAISEKTVTIDLNGKTLEYKGKALEGGAILVSGGANLTLNDTSSAGEGSVTSANSAAVIELNGAGTLNITGGEFTSTKSGGAAIAVAQQSSKGDIALNITGGSFVADKVISETNPQASDSSPQVTLNVAGGKFNGAIEIADSQRFLAGGVYSVQPNSDYIVEEKMAIENTDEKTADDYPWMIVSKYVVTTNSMMLSKAGKVTGVTGIATLTGGGKYTENEDVTMSASAVDNFEFIGWYKGSYEENNKLTDSMTYKFKATADIDCIAVYKANATDAKITVSSSDANKGNVAIDGVEGTSTSVNVGLTITVRATANEGSNFICWQNAAGAVVSTNNEYTCTATQSKTLKALFLDEGAAIVYFKDSDGSLISSKVITETQAKDGEVTQIVAPSKKGQKFTSWVDDEGNKINDTTVKTSIANTTAESGHIGTVYLSASYAEADKYTVTIHFVDTEGNELRKDITKTEEVGNPLVATADETIGDKIFQGYRVTDTEDIITNSLQYTFNPEKGSYQYDAVYGTDEITARNATLTLYEPFVASTNVNKIGYTMSWAIPEGCTLKEAGVSYGLSTDDVDKNAYVNRTTLTGNTGSLTVYVGIGSAKLDANVYLRAFITYNDGKADHTIMLGEAKTVTTGYDVGGNYLTTTYNTLANAAS